MPTVELLTTSDKEGEREGALSELGRGVGGKCSLFLSNPTVHFTGTKTIASTLVVRSDPVSENACAASETE